MNSLVVVLEFEVVNALNQLAQLHLVTGGLATKANQLLVLVVALVLEFVQGNLCNRCTLGNGIHEHWQHGEHALCRSQLLSLSCRSGLCALNGLLGLGNLGTQAARALTLDSNTLDCGTEFNSNV